MLPLRSVLAKALTARTLAPQVCASFATGPRQNDGTFYEFRTYSLKPSKMNEFLENFRKNLHLRTAHSELVGYWSVEFGGRINKVFHIWKYDNFAHRTAVRKALAKDKEWQEQFLIPNLSLMDKQESEITYLVPWCKLEKPPKEGVYELATFQMKPGGPALWGDAFRRSINAHVDRGYTRLVGVFHTEYGTLNRVHVLWWNESADSRAAGRHLSHEDPRVVAAGNDEVVMLILRRHSSYSEDKNLLYTKFRSVPQQKDHLTTCHCSQSKEITVEPGLMCCQKKNCLAEVLQVST